MSLGIGIDTGGTYTDAVVYDFDTKVVLEAAKSLTTKQDLSLGIINALEKISGELLDQAEILSLSTTLATNACVENRGGNAKLIIFGGDAGVIDRMGAPYGLPPADEIYIQESFTSYTGEVKKEPDWDVFQTELDSGYEDIDCIGIVEINAMRTGALAEKKAKDLFAEKYDIPAICGHELFSDINYLQRGSSALLNARLYPVIKDFIKAIKVAVDKKGIKAKLIIMRSDGSVMSEAFASLHPVETLLCGPAASALGGLNLCDEPNGVVIDMGGTTTDIALIKSGVPISTSQGVSIGKWKTFVKGLYNKTVGLGGDSAVHYAFNHLIVEEYRVAPLCETAANHPEVITNLKTLVTKYKKEKIKHSKFVHEHLLLIRSIGDNPRYSERERRLCKALENGPMILIEAAEAAGTDVYNLDLTNLVRDDIVQVCGLTPTDIMHIRGEFNLYSTEAAQLGAEFVALNLDMSVERLCEEVYREVKRKLYFGIVQILLENQDKYYQRQGVEGEVERIINYNYQQAEKRLAQCQSDEQADGDGDGSPEDYLVFPFSTEYSLVGTGAPIHVFLDDVAKMLNTKAVIPANHEVANAVGAVTGNISAGYSIEIAPYFYEYIVYGINENRHYMKKDEAEAFAIEQAVIGAKAEALDRGAKGHLTVFTQIDNNIGTGKEGAVFLGSTVTAQAVGGFFGE